MKFRSLAILGLTASLMSAVACSSPAPAPSATSVPQPPATSAAPASNPTSAPAAATAAPATPGATAAPAPTKAAGSGAAPTPAPSAIAPSAGSGAPTSTGGVARMKSPEAGVQLFMWGVADIGRDLKLAKDGGFTWVKQMFQWNFIERDGKGRYLWNEPDRLVKAANNYGLKMVARIDFSPDWAKASAGYNAPPQNLEDFGDFIYAVVSRYKAGSPYGQIHAYEIWNEPNLSREWGDKAPNAAEYVELLKVAYKAAKKADPSATIVTAGLSPTGTTSPEARPDDVYLEEMYKAGAKEYFDVLGVHAAGFKAPPETSPDEIAAKKEYGGQRFFGFRRVEDLRQIMVKNGDEKKQVMVLEMGWTTDNRPGSPYAWHAVTEKEKGEYIVRAYQYAQKSWAPWIGVMSTIYISAPHWTEKDEQYFWALTEPDGTPRASYDYVKGKLP
ncbi:MAG: cellulase family glycosylhydrolase [Chloroflexota bacterium]